MRFTLGVQHLEPRFALAAAPVFTAVAGQPLPAEAPAAAVQAIVARSGSPTRALSDITIQGISDAFTNGYGGVLGPSDPYFPGTFNNDVTVSGLAGATYYVVDQALNTGLPNGAVNYFFEAGAVGLRSTAFSTKAGLVAAVYAGTGQIVSPGIVSREQVTDALNRNADVGQAIRSLTAGLTATPQQQAAVAKLAQGTRFLQGVGLFLTRAQTSPPQSVTVQGPGLKRLDVQLPLNESGTATLLVRVRPAPAPQLQARTPSGTTLTASLPPSAR